MTRVRLTAAERARVFEAARGFCALCKLKIAAGERWEVIHPIALGLGGRDVPWNRAPAHYRCHRTQTAKVDQPQIAKATRQYEKHIGASLPSRRPLPGGKGSKLKRKMDGTVVIREREPC